LAEPKEHWKNKDSSELVAVGELRHNDLPTTTIGVITDEFALSPFSSL
jgi:hypothetical protein